MKIRSVERAIALSIILATIGFSQVVLSTIAQRPPAERYAPRVTHGPAIDKCELPLWERVIGGCRQ